MLLAPAVIGLALLVVSFGRRVDAAAQVRTAAEAAAEAAALERSLPAARAAATATAMAMLTSTDSCANPAVEVSTSATGLGLDAGMISVTVSCTATNRGIESVQPGDITTSATAFATVDLFRAREG